MCFATFVNLLIQHEKKHVFPFSNPTYFSVKTISPEIFGEFLHVAGETPESVNLRVKHLQEPAAQVIHSLGITDL